MFHQILKKHNNIVLLFLIISVGVISLGIFFFSGVIEYTTNDDARGVSSARLGQHAEAHALHKETPSDGVRALYMSSWVAGNQKLRSNIVELIEQTGLNAVVIDIKDVTGRVTYDTQNLDVLAFGNVVENRIPDFSDFIQELHEKDIYVIGRIAVFQDNFSARNNPQYAVKNPNGTLWEDRRGLTWFDAGSPPVWEYTVALAKDAYRIGIDEINFDYVRFPSDGNTKNMILPYTGSDNKPATLKKFFAFIDEELRFSHDIPVSADVFGITTTTEHDIGIGQIFTDIIDHVDAIAPMIYPSHYPAGFRGYSNPATSPYEIITLATEGAITKIEDAGLIPQEVLRPWIQDFDLGATYTPERVQAQIQALYDLGITSFFVWDPANSYTTKAYTSFNFYPTTEENIQ